MSGKKRGFIVTHQRVQLDIDFAGYIKATTWLTIRPNETRLEAVYLHASPSLTITSITLSAPAPNPLPELPASYFHLNPLLSLTTDLDPSKPLIDQHPDYKRRLWTSLAEKEEGELCIDVRNGWVRLPQSREGYGQNVKELAEIVVKIDYEIVMSDASGGEGVVWRRPGDNGLEDRIPHIFLNSSSHSSARNWIPCVDSPWSRHTWELEITAPTHLHQYITASPSSSRKILRSEKVIVVASGELEEQVRHPDDSTKTIWYYVMGGRVSVQHVGWAMGPFVMHHIPVEKLKERDGVADADGLDGTTDGGEKEDGEGENTELEETQPLMLAFSLPGYEIELAHTTSCMRRAMDFYTSTFGSYPYQSFKMVFVDDPSPLCGISAGMATISSELLYPPEIIEQAFITRPTLTHALAAQWVGVNIVPKTYSDTWLIIGLSLYMNAMFLKALLGNNEHRYKLKMDMERCVAMDKGDQFPLEIAAEHEPPDEGRLQFMALKAPLVLHILDIRLAKVGTSLGLARIIPKIFLDSLSGDLPNNMLTTHYFLKTCKKASGVDLSGFHEEWIAGSGCPTIKVGAIYKHGTGIMLTVAHPASRAYDRISEQEPNMLAWKKPTKHFEGTLTILVHEGEDAPTEHVIDVEEGTHEHELPYHTKDRRYRGRLGARRTTAKRLAELSGQVGEEEDVPQTQAQMEADYREDQEWRFFDYSETERQDVIKIHGYDWLTFDPDCEWVGRVEWIGAKKPNPLFWISQLRWDRDVIGQHEALRQLAKAKPSKIISTIVAKTLRDDSYCFRIRMEAAEALSKMSVGLDEQCPSLSAYHLLKIYKTEYCKRLPAEFDEVLPAPKDFRSQYVALPPDAEDVEEQLLYKAIVSAVSRIRFDKDASPVYALLLVRTILNGILDDAQPEGTIISPSYAIASAIAGLARWFSDAAAFQSKMGAMHITATVRNIERWLSLDRLVPSYGNVITIAGLQTLLAHKIGFQRSEDSLAAAVPFYLPYTREGNCLALRKIALDCVMTCSPLAPWINRYLSYITTKDSSLSMRQYAADSLSRAWLMRLALGEIPNLHELKANIVQIEDQAKDQAALAETDARKHVSAMRQALAEVTQLKETISQLLSNHLLPTSALLSILQAAETVVSATPTRIRITLNPKAQQNRSITLRIPTLNGNGTTDSGRSGQRAMPPEDMKACKHMMKSMKQAPEHEIFLWPVNEAEAPGYYSIVKNPMCLSKVEQKLEGGLYNNRLEFKNDIMLIVRNGKAYNHSGDTVYLMTEAFENFFLEKWNEWEKAFISKADKADKAAKAAKAAKPGAMLPPAVPVKPQQGLLLKLGSTSSPGLGVPPPLQKGKSLVRFADSTKVKSETSIFPAGSSSSSGGIKLKLPASLPAVGNKRAREMDTVEDDSLEAELDLMEAAGSSGKSKSKAGGVKDDQGGPIAKKPKVTLSTSVEKEKKPMGRPPKNPLIRKESTSSYGGDSPSPGPSSAPGKSSSNKAFAKPSLPPSKPKAATPAPSNRPAEPNAAMLLPAPVALHYKDWRSLPNMNTPYIHPRVKKYLKELSGQYDAFAAPVTDQQAANYSKEIKHPMDLGTMSKKAEKGTYRVMGDVLADFKLIVGNCRQYNGFTMDYFTTPFEDKIHNDWKILSHPAPDQAERGTVNKWIVKTISTGNGGWFKDPVPSDPGFLAGYWDKIRREDARDFTSIQTKLVKCEHRSFEHLDADIYQLCKNAIVYNPPAGEAYVLAMGIRKSYETMRKTIEPHFKPKESWL